MALKIFGNAENAAPKKKSFSDDVVGRLRSGYVENDRPVALQEWRVTTGDPVVADRIVELLGGPDGVSSWETKGEDDKEVFTTSSSVDIIIEKATALRQDMVMYTRKGIAYVSDGEQITYPDERKGQPDPQAGQTFQERKAAAKDGTGADPRIQLYFRLADDPDLGIFKFQSGSWSLVSDLSYHGVEDELADLTADGASVRATLALEQVSFVAKSGPRAGQTVEYTKPSLTLKGVA